MTAITLFVAALFLLSILTLLLNLFLTERSPVLIGVGILPALVFGLLSFVAMFEAKSVYWGFGYSSVSILFGIGILKNAISKPMVGNED